MKIKQGKGGQSLHDVLQFPYDRPRIADFLPHGILEKTSLQAFPGIDMGSTLCNLLIVFSLTSPYNIPFKIQCNDFESQNKIAFLWSM